MAAVLTVLAAKQLSAATLTLRHTGSADAPVRGSTMWWCAVESTGHQIKPESTGPNYSNGPAPTRAHYGPGIGRGPGRPNCWPASGAP